MSDEQMRFGRGSASVEQLRAAINDVLAQPDIAERDDMPDRIDISEDGQGFDPITVAIVVTLVKLSGHVATKAWDDVIWPRVREKLGGDDDLLGDRKDR